jgi:hypothetical protein
VSSIHFDEAGVLPSFSDSVFVVSLRNTGVEPITRTSVAFVLKLGLLFGVNPVSTMGRGKVHVSVSQFASMDPDGSQLVSTYTGQQRFCHMRKKVCF